MESDEKKEGEKFANEKKKSRRGVEPNGIRAKEESH